jgi:hypothetical protein
MADICTLLSFYFCDIHMHLGLLDGATADNQKLLVLNKETKTQMLLISYNVVISDRSSRRFGRSIGTGLGYCGM